MQENGINTLCPESLEFLGPEQWSWPPILRPSRRLLFQQLLHGRDGRTLARRPVAADFHERQPARSERLAPQPPPSLARHRIGKTSLRIRRPRNVRVAEQPERVIPRAPLRLRAHPRRTRPRKQPVVPQRAGQQLRVAKHRTPRPRRRVILAG